MLLIGVEDFRQRVGFDPLSTRDRQIEAQLRASTQALSTDLRTRLDYREVTDVFRVERTHVRRMPAHQAEHLDLRTWRWSLSSGLPTLHTRLLLSRGFVDTAHTDGVEVYTASTPAQLSAPASRRDLLSAELREYGSVFLDAERGHVTVEGFGLSGSYVGVTYRAGLYENSDEVAEGAPDWLVELAFSHALLMLDSNPVFRRENQRSGDLDAQKQAVANQLRDHVRYDPAAVRPIRGAVL